MEHDSARELLAELATGRLENEVAADVRAHAEGCDDCALTLRLAQTLRREVRESGSSFLTSHPLSIDLADCALDAAGQSAETQAAIDAHVAMCPACAEELAHARAVAGAPLEAPVLAGPSRWRATMPLAAAAVAVLALSLPAYRGLVELPRVEQEAHTTAERLAADNQRLSEQLQHRDTSGPAGGPARLLYLGDPVRGEGDAVPALRPTAGAALVPIVIAADLTRDGMVTPATTLTVRIARAGNEVWRADTRLADIWDGDAHIASLLVPAVALPPATYTLRVDTAAGAPLYRTTFVIAR